jgi:hypothetical protein
MTSLTSFPLPTAHWAILFIDVDVLVDDGLIDVDFGGGPGNGMRLSCDGVLIASNNGQTTENIGSMRSGVSTVSLIIDFNSQMFEWEYNGTNKGKWSLATAGLGPSSWPLYAVYMSGWSDQPTLMLYHIMSWRPHKKRAMCYIPNRSKQCSLEHVIFNIIKWLYLE